MNTVTSSPARHAWLPTLARRLAGPQRLPFVLLASSLGTALLVSALIDVPEVTPFGHEVGFVLSSLAYAYVGAWIFHQVIVEQPRKAAAKRAYDAAWVTLSQLATNGPTLLFELSSLAYFWDKGEPTERDSIIEFAEKIWLGTQVSRFSSNLFNPASLLRTRHDLHGQAIRAVRPYVHLFDPEVAAALIEMDCSHAISVLSKAKRKAEIQTVGTVEGAYCQRLTLANTHMGEALAEYVNLCSRLKSALELAQPQRTVKSSILTMGAWGYDWNSEGDPSKNPTDRLYGHWDDDEDEPTPQLYPTF